MRSFPSPAVGADGARVVCGAFDYTVALRDLARCRLEITLVGHEDLALAVAVTSNGDEIVSGSGEGTVRVWTLGLFARHPRLCRALHRLHARRSAAEIARRLDGLRERGRYLFPNGASR